MIDEARTFAEYGYRSTDTKCRRVITLCEGCGAPRDVSKYNIPSLCRKCVMKGRTWSDARCKEWSERRTGENNPNFGNIGEKNPWTGGKASLETREKMAEAKRGDKNNMYGLPVPEERRERISAGLSGANHPNYGKRGKDTTNWQGGLTDKIQALRNTQSYKNWRESVYERDAHTCQECGARSHSGNPVYLNAHHINPIKDNKNTLLIFDIDNGITLCEGCHNTTKGHEEDFVDRYTAIVHN